MTSPKITRPALRYYGGKWRIASWVIAHQPPCGLYVEPFAGAASVLLRRRPVPFEVLNDVDSNVVNFFQILRDRTDELRRAVELTPYSREETILACAPTPDPLERARRFYVRSWQTMHGAPHMGNNGWRFGRQGGNGCRNTLDDWLRTPPLLKLLAERLRSVQIENDDALKILRRFDSPDTLFYCDPPYVRDTRSDRWASNGYVHELTDWDHHHFLELIVRLKGMAVISGYACELYDERLAGWKRVERKTKYGRNHQGTHRGSTEVLWISPNASARIEKGGVEA